MSVDGVRHACPLLRPLDAQRPGREGRDVRDRDRQGRRLVRPPRARTWRPDRPQRPGPPEHARRAAPHPQMVDGGKRSRAPPLLVDGTQDNAPRSEVPQMWADRGSSLDVAVALGPWRATPDPVGIPPAAHQPTSRSGREPAVFTGETARAGSMADRRGRPRRPRTPRSPPCPALPAPMSAAGSSSSRDGADGRPPGMARPPARAPAR